MAESDQNTNRETIINHLKGKSVLKQDIYDHALTIFHDFGSEIKSMADDLKKELAKSDKRINIDYHDKTNFETELKIADDTLIFVLHTDVFTFEKSDVLWKTYYLDENPDRS
ncbi:MAG: hypothetical protein WCL14_12635, partial [Bacteroidota bacterium]